MSRINELELIKIINGPPFESFVHRSNLFRTSKHDFYQQVIFTEEGGHTLSVNVSGLTRSRIIPESQFVFSGEYYVPIMTDGKSQPYIIGMYNTTTRKGWCYIFTKGYLLENNPIAALAIGLLSEHFVKPAPTE